MASRIVSSLTPAARRMAYVSGARTFANSSVRCADNEVSVIQKSAEFKDIKTHTHQEFEKDDFRVMRFINREKEVNPRFAIDLIAEAPPQAVEARATFCDGGDGPLGHPRVFINLDQPGNHSCGYCGLRFFQDKKHHH
jgi:NADH dehydrogenase (ubiquinone) Fe-S protein 6